MQYFQWKNINNKKELYFEKKLQKIRTIPKNSGKLSNL